MGWLDTLLQGRNPYGSAGFNIATTDPNDPRYQQFASSGTPWDDKGGSDPARYNTANGDIERLNRSGLTQVGGYADFNNTPGQILDPSRITYDPVFGLVTPTANMRSNDGTFMDRYGMGLMAGAGILGPMALGAMGGLGAGAVDAGATAGSSLPDSYWGMTAANTGSTATDAGIVDASGAASNTLPQATGAFDSGIGASGAGAGVTPSLYGGAIGPNTLLGQVSGVLSGAAPASGLLGTLGTAAMNNPLQAYGLLSTVRGLVTRPPTPNAGDNGIGSKGGSGTPAGAPTGDLRGTWTPNAITAGQLANFRPARVGKG